MSSITLQCHALGDDTRWQILTSIGTEPRSASELADQLPISRQAIAKHLAVLEAAGLAIRERHGRQVRHRALGSELTTLAQRLEQIGTGWEDRLGRLTRVAESRAED